MLKPLLFAALLPIATTHAADSSFRCLDGTYNYGEVMVEKTADVLRFRVSTSFQPFTDLRLGDITGRSEDAPLWLTQLAVEMPASSCVSSNQDRFLIRCLPSAGPRKISVAGMSPETLAQGPAVEAQANIRLAEILKVKEKNASGQVQEFYVARVELRDPNRVTLARIRLDLDPSMCKTAK